MTILFLGGHTLDMVYRLDALPEGNAKAKARGVYTAAGGPALNAAITCAILGKAAVFAGALGEGPFTDAIKSEAGRYRVRLIRLGAREGDAPCASVALTPGGARTIWAPPQARPPEGAFEDLPAADGFAALLVDGQLPDAAIAAARAFRAAEKPVVLDAGGWKPGMEQLITLSTHVIASAAFEIPGETDTHYALLKAGAAFAAITRDDAPVVWTTAVGGRGEIAPPKVEAVDTLAAGDILHGAFMAYRFSQGLGDVDALARAVEVASASVAEYGPRAGVLKIAEVR